MSRIAPGTARLHHASLTVEAIEPAIAFFRDVFGFEPDFVEYGMEGDIVALTGKDGLTCDFAQLRSDFFPVVLELIAFHSDREPRPEGDALPWRPGAGHVCFHVDDFDDAVKAVTEHGASVLGRAIDFPGGRSIYCRAPGGAFFEIEHMTGNSNQQET